MPGDLALKKFKAGTLHSGSKTGPIVHKKSQALAIMLSEQRKEKAAKAGKAKPGPMALRD